MLIESTSSYPFFFVLLQLFIAVGLVIFVILSTHFLGPKRQTKEKLTNFECGIESIGNARQPVSVKYFLIAILFVLFDVEIIFFYPYAVNIKSLGLAGFGAILTFIGLFLTGYVYLIKKGALDWEK